MEEYFIYFHDSYQTEERLYQAKEAIKVNEMEMFEWVEQSHENNDLKFCIYKCEIVCDLS